MNRFRLVFILSMLLAFSACVKVSFRSKYDGPPARDTWIEEYYNKGNPYGEWKEQEVLKERRYNLSQITIQSHAGEIVVDYYKRREPSDILIFVFPILGGSKNIIASHFAENFARRGFDAAIIHRDKDFKNPENVDRLEEILHDAVIRDRLAIDFFEKEKGKKRFGSFGISRGGINVAITAGIDPRLEYNVIALGGTKLVRLFAKSSQGGIKKYRKAVQAEKHISGEQFIKLLNAQIRTDPINVAHHIDARKTLMFLSVFDSTVPIRYGKKLREQIGKPDTIYLVADHKTSVLYTQFVPLFPPNKCFGIFPFDYIETESLYFYDRYFKTGEVSVKHFIYSIFQLPFTIGERISRLF